MTWHKWHASVYLWKIQHYELNVCFSWPLYTCKSLKFDINFYELIFIYVDSSTATHLPKKQTVVGQHSHPPNSMGGGVHQYSISHSLSQPIQNILTYMSEPPEEGGISRKNLHIHSENMQTLGKCIWTMRWPCQPLWHCSDNQKYYFNQSIFLIGQHNNNNNENGKNPTGAESCIKPLPLHNHHQTELSLLYTIKANNFIFFKAPFPSGFLL